MRLEVVDFNNLDKVFEYDLEEEERIKLNKVLISNRFNIIEKRYILFITNFLKENTYIDNKLEINFLTNFLDFILDEEIFNKLDLFMVDMLYSICNNINIANNKVRLGEGSEENIIIKHNTVFEDDTLKLDEINRLKIKINTSIKLANSIIKIDSKLDNRKYYRILNKILLSNKNANNYYFIVKLFDNEKISNYKDKRNIIFNYLLNNSICSINNYILDILSNDDILNIDDDKYMELASILFSLDEREIDIYYSIISREDLSLNRKIIVINYIKIMIGKVKNTYYLDKVIREELNVFNVVYSNYFKSLNDDEFKIYLDKILNSNKPMSYIKVLIDTKLDDEKKDYALSLINEREVIVNDNRAFDYMEYVSLSAISPLLKELDINEYKIILNIVNEYSNIFYNLIEERYKDSSKLIDDRIILNDIVKGITSILYEKNLYINNMERFYYTVNILLNIKDSYYNEVISFATSDKSKYYTDKEYKDILKLIERAYNNDRLYDYYMNSCSLYTDDNYLKSNRLISSLDGRDGAMLIVDLFTNANIMFMEDKSILFEIAENGNKDDIINFIKELKRQGNYNRNMNSILRGVEESTSLVIMPSIKRIKEYKI